MSEPDARPFRPGPWVRVIRRFLGRFLRPFRAAYGDQPAHLLLLVATLALAGYAVWQWIAAPTPIRLLIWFGAAVIAHDLIAFPIYSALDRLLVRAVGGTARDNELNRWRRAAINHIRIPGLLSVLLLAMWYPLILVRSDRTYFAASGQHQGGYLGNWLLAVAILFGISLVTFVLRLAGAAGRSRSGASPPRTTPEVAIPARPEPEKNQP